MKANSRLKRKDYETHLRQLQAELCLLQDWFKHEELRVIILFEGRDGAGKGGTIKAITERVSPRVFRVVALPAPSDREKSQITCSATCSTFRRLARSSSSTAAGITAPVWSGSWVFATRHRRASSCRPCRSSRRRWWSPESS